MGLASLAVVAILALAACSGGSSSSRGGASRSAGFNAAVSMVVNPSGRKGKTLTFGLSGTPDSTDPANIYDAFMWDFSRLYTMPLMTYKSCPGACGLQVVPDLATAPGTVSDRGLTWTYHIKPDVRFEDGTTVTSADVKYAVERTFDRSLFPLGPPYYPVLLGGNAKTYPGPYTNPAKNKFGLTAVGTPNTTTIVFHLAHPFADFNFVTAIPQSAPVLPNKDTRAAYRLHPMSTGPYKFQSYQLNKHLVLVPNSYWNPATDPNARQLVSKIVVTMNMNPGDLATRLLAGELDVNLAGAGLQAAAQTKILSRPSLKARADDPVSGLFWFAYLNTVVPPMNHVHCRKAIEYAADKVSLQAAYGGPYAGGAIASTVSPPNVAGHQSFDLYDALSKPQGDLVAARAQLKLCGHPAGFTTGIAYRRDRPKEAAAAAALRRALSRVGIKTTLHGYPAANYYASFAGVPRYVHQHDLGIDFGGWAPDWPDGFGSLDFITAGSTIRAVGNTNVEQLNDPVVNRYLNQMALATNAAHRNSYTSKIDMRVMNDAAILPAVYAKSLLYRGPVLTNVYVQPYYGMYNYAVLGLK
jgi:peptide/nickel transport system substrate-binding protein